MNVIVSCPGKIHLMGEHAVVYGAPAFLSAINRRVVVTVKPSSSGLILHTNIDDGLHEQAMKLIKKSVSVVCDRLRIPEDPSVDISVVSGILAGRHLGSSAAVSVACVGALLYFFKKIWNPDLINKLAFDVEKVQHGNPSGGDNSACTYGGLLWFRKELDFLKTIWQLPYPIHADISPFYLIDTGQPKENTGEMVRMVRTFMEEFSDNGRLLLFQNEQATKDVATALKSGNEDLLIDAMKRGEKTLEGMGVVSARVLPVIEDIETAGGCAKILGGGGKHGAVGYVLAYHHDKKKLKDIVKKHGYELESVLLAEEGVRLESGREK